MTKLAINSLVVNPRSSSQGTAWARKIDAQESITVIGEAVSTYAMGKVTGGTAMGMVTASKKYRPAVSAVLTAASAASTTVTLGTSNVQLVRNGDIVNLTSLLGVAGTVTMSAVGGAGKDLIFTSTTNDGFAHSIAIIDPSAASKPLAVLVHTIAAGVHTIQIQLETNGASAIQTTLAQIMATVHNELPEVTVTYGGTAVGSETSIAVAATPLAGGTAIGGTLNSTLTISARAAAGTLTVSSAVTAEIGDYLVETDGSQTAIGILLYSTQSADGVDDDGDVVQNDQPGILVIRGVADESECIGINTQTKAALEDHITFR